MGGSSYDFSARSTRSATYAVKSLADTFEQSKTRMIHESMEPKAIKIREARDSAVHPNTVPIILGMDVTGSMGIIPHNLVKEGLPKLMSSIINGGVPDAALLFIAVGDHISDRYPIQVGQFESGDEELDMWLTRTYLEGNGGGNGGESYSLVWDFADRFVVTDAWEKRKQKGFIFTFGDEPIHPVIPASFINATYENAGAEGSVTSEELLRKIEEKWNYIHIHINHGYRSQSAENGLRDLLGEHLIVTQDYTKIPEIIAQYVLKNVQKGVESGVETTPQQKQNFEETEIIL
jgi:hypothetical protein